MDVDHWFGPSIGNVYGNKPFRNISGRPFPEVSVAIMMNISSRSVLPLFSTAFSVRQNIAAGFILSARLFGVVYAVVAHIH